MDITNTYTYYAFSIFVLWIKLRALHMLGKYATTQLYPQTLIIGKAQEELTTIINDKIE
jgi:hypothetical protein